MLIKNSRTFSVLTIALLATASFLSLLTVSWITQASQWQTHTFLVINKAENILSVVTDAETGQRGYLLTRDERFLEPYLNAVTQIDDKLAELQQFTLENPAQQQLLSTLKTLIADKLATLKETIAIQQHGETETALTTVKKGHSKELMDAIRRLLTNFMQQEFDQLNQRSMQLTSNLHYLILSIAASACLVMLVSGGSSYQIRELNKEIRRNAALQTTLLDNADAAIISTTPDGIITSINRGVKQLLGYQRQELVGKQSLIIFHDADEITARTAQLNSSIAPSFKNLVALLNHDRQAMQDWIYLRKDGTRVPVQLTISAMSDDLGQLIGFLCLAIDITRRKEAETQLKDSEKFTSSVLNALSKQFCVLDQVGNILAVNKPWLDFEREQNSDTQTPEIGQNYPALLDAGLAKNRGGAAFSEGLRSVLNGSNTHFSLEYADRTQAQQLWFIGKVIPFPGLKLGHVIVIHENISEHKRLEHRFRQAVELGPHAIAMVNASGAIVMVNAQTEAYFGYSRTELLGQPLEILVPERFRSKHFDLRKAYSAAPQSRLMYSGLDIYALRKNGTEFPVEIGLSLIDSHEEILILSTIIDTTERKLIKTQLQDNEERLNFALETLQTGTWELDLNSLITHRTLLHDQIFGYTTQQSEWTFQTFLNHVIPEDQAAVTECFTTANTRQIDWNIDCRIRRTDGEIRWLWVMGRRKYDNSGHQISIAGIVQDITDRKQIQEALKTSESALKEAQRLAGLGRWKWDSQTKDLSWSEEIYHIYGRDPTLPPVNYPEIRQYLTPDSWTQLNVAIKKSLSEGTTYECDAEVVRPDGSHRWIFARGEATLDSIGNVVNLHGTVQDITERKLASDKLKEALNEKELLLKEVYHRVKNNLQVVSSLLNLQASSINNEAATNLLKQSADRIKSMALIHEKLYQSKNLSKIDFNAYIHSLVDHLQFSYGTHSSKIHISMDIGDLLLTVDTAITCGLIINELLSNALKHAFPDDRSGEIGISFRQDQNEFILIITDNGIGFPIGLDYKKSNSLGLKLVTTLTNQLQGKLNLDQTTGSTFTIRFTNA